ncbi:hypothetical protein LR48_Vigan04g039700 [Vigna angularis]|uniref:AP180 N-terminal homology (ANTH) domain-containing protein n=1 Tax=Phaseolus angularis TaxID=3914 RepID=A0A0L9UCF0_PHAAN|nr:hypothetical protein LR48_Vigan04g039700 [Vigna angularis]
MNPTMISGDDSPITVEITPLREASNVETLLSGDSAFVYGNVKVEGIEEEEDSDMTLGELESLDLFDSLPRQLVSCHIINCLGRDNLSFEVFAYASDKGKLSTELKESRDEVAALKLKLEEEINAHSQSKKKHAKTTLLLANIESAMADIRKSGRELQTKNEELVKTNAKLTATIEHLKEQNSKLLEHGRHLDTACRDAHFSIWIRHYALYLEERIQCFNVINYDAATNSSVAGESVKLYVAITVGVVELLDKFFEMYHNDARSSLRIYKKSVTQGLHDLLTGASEFEEKSLAMTFIPNENDENRTTPELGWEVALFAEPETYNGNITTEMENNREKVGGMELWKDDDEMNAEKEESVSEFSSKVRFNPFDHEDEQFNMPSPNSLPNIPYELGEMPYQHLMQQQKKTANPFDPSTVPTHPTQTT